MIKNYFTIAWRNLVRNPTFYFINIVGLSVGLACCLLISAYLYSELTYDSYAEKAQTIYRVDLKVTGNGSVVHYPSADVGVGPGMKNTFPEVEAFTRLSPSWQPYLHYKDITLKEEHLAMADSNFLQVFDIPLVAGDEKSALVEPNSIVVTRAFAQKYFGEEDPMGKSLTFGQHGEFKVTGLINAIPDKTHFHFDAFASLSTWHLQRETWSNLGMYTYLVLNKNSNPDQLQAKFPLLVEKYVVPEVQHDMGVSLAEAQKSVNTFIFALTPLRDIHLYSHTAMELEPNGDITYIYIFSALAVFILLIACVNFTNLSTASSLRRAREVGIRKVIGSAKHQLIYQFLTESILLSAGATAIAYVLVYFLLPYFSHLTGKPADFGFFLEPVTIIVVMAGLVVVGIVAGIYPAFFLSSFNILNTLKANTSSSAGKRDGLRSGLVVFQFAVSTSLIIATLVVYQQLHFMQNKKLGYEKDQVLVFQDTYILRKDETLFKDQLLKDSRVLAASVARQVPGGKSMDGTQAFPKDRKENENNAEIHIDISHVDYDYLGTLGIALKSGRNLSPAFPSDSSAVVINETAAKELGWGVDNALGKTLVTSGQNEYHVVGVVNDFNYASVREKIGAMVMMLGRNSGLTIVKINTQDIPGFLETAKKQWTAFTPDMPFSYWFLDEKFSALYRSEERTGQLFTTFAIIALVIAGLGLFGLSTYTAEQRTREIGIRKVLGASSGRILVMLSKQFMILVLVAFVIAVPLVAWAMNQWLEEFAYRITISWWVFTLAGASSFAIAFISMGFQTIRAAIANPIQSLKAE